MSLSATSPLFLNTSRDGDSTTPWAAVPTPNHAFGEGIFPNIQPEPPLAQCEAVAYHSVKEFISIASEDLEGKKSNDQIFRVAQLTQTGQHAFCALEGLFGLAVV